ncbi:MAG: cell division protein FtsK, partial [Actinomycetes bacterium]
LAMMVRTDYMPNNDWTTLCERGRELRATAGTLTGHAISTGSTPVLDPATVAHVIGASQVTDEEPPVRDLPEPLASVVAYLGTDLHDEDREFIPTAELVDALDVEPTAFGRQMGELGCRPRPGRIVGGDGTSRQARGYLTADIRAAIQAQQDDPEVEGDLA